ncbi:MAG: hypothetical protein OXL96_24510 [Candidatus Poribacteria bacterium]|nr:hypothetical protein [Candidatus Poribacteria bacterium]
MANSENTITSAFVNVLRPMRDAWNINEQITKPFLNATQKLDIIVTEKGRNPIVIEVPESESDPVLFITESAPDNETAPESFPQSGWLSGSVADIATAIRVRATPISNISADMEHQIISG